MQFITVREFRSSTAKVWRKLRSEQQLVLTRRGKPVAMVTATDENKIGDLLLEAARRKGGEAIERIQRDAEKRGLSGMSMKQIDQLIAETRKAKRE